MSKTGFRSVGAGAETPRREGLSRRWTLLEDDGEVDLDGDVNDATVEETFELEQDVVDDEQVAPGEDAETEDEDGDREDEEAGGEAIGYASPNEDENAPQEDEDEGSKQTAKVDEEEEDEEEKEEDEEDDDPLSIPPASRLPSVQVFADIQEGETGCFRCAQPIPAHAQACRSCFHALREWVMRRQQRVAKRSKI